MSKCSKCGAEGKFEGDYFNLSIIKGVFICRNGCCGQIYKNKNTNGVTKYSTELGMEVNSKEIDRICKEKGLVYMSDSEIERECKKNKEYNINKAYSERSSELRDKLRRVL